MTLERRSQRAINDDGPVMVGKPTLQHRPEVICSSLKGVCHRVRRRGNPDGAPARPYGPTLFKVGEEPCREGSELGRSLGLRHSRVGRRQGGVGAGVGFRSNGYGRAHRGPQPS